jgi:hypothetical protein
VRKLLSRLAGWVAFIGTAGCGITLGALAGGGRMFAWEQFMWPLITLVFALICGKMRKDYRRVMDLANTQTDVLTSQAGVIAEQRKQLLAATRLLRTPDQWSPR